MPLLALGFAAGCAEFAESTKQVTYAGGAKDNYDRGAVALREEAWPEAIKFFSYTRSKFGFSKWATLAELGIADAEFGREKYQEAVDAYRGFIKNHPMHERVQDGYAAFRIGESYYKEIPTEWFMVPAGYEKDMGPVKDALRELTAFAAEYGDSPYAPRSRKMIGDCVKRLTDHELYVAQFYLGRGKPLASVGRLEGMVRDYPGSNREPEVMLLLGQTFLQMEKPGDAQKVFARLVATHAEDFRAKKAQLYLDYIARRFPNLPPPTPGEIPPSLAPGPARIPTAPSRKPAGGDSDRPDKEHENG